MGGSQTSSLASLPKISKNYESTTATTSIVFHTIRQFSANLKNPSLRDLPKASRGNP
ncbi:hypothetical protein ACWIUD_03630 [Helicobacter sp. 23-1044]